MCGVIVVDAESFQSTCHRRDAYIHDHCLRNRHNFTLFYQLLNSNLFTHRMCSFKGEASTTRKNLTSSVGFLHTSSVGARATAMALQLNISSSAFSIPRCRYAKY